MKLLINSLLAVSLLNVTAFSMGGEADAVENGLKTRSDLVFYGGFETPTCTGSWQTAWSASYIQGCNRLRLIEGSKAFRNTKSLEFTLEAGQFGNGCKVQFPMNFKTMPGSPQKTYDSLYLRYYVNFEQGFDFKKGGKLPGMMSVDGNSISGGAQPDGTNGWTMRYMWSSGGKAVIYSYLPEGFKYAGGAWGKTMALKGSDGQTMVFKPGQWHCLEQFIKLNSIGKEDGKLKIWFDGKECLNFNDVTYRTVDNEKGRIGGIFFSVFHGGNDASYAPSVNSNIMFDGMVAATKPVGTFSDGAQGTGIKVAQNKEPQNVQKHASITAMENSQYYKVWAGKSLNGVYLNLVDVSGRTIKSNWKIAKENENYYALFSVNGLARGVYTATLHNGNGIISSEKVVVK